MGLETHCTLRLGREAFTGTAHLDSTAVAFRGGAKLLVALTTVRSATVGATGELRVVHTAGTFSLVLGDRTVAEKWALKIRSPKSLVDKLGLKPESHVAILGVADPVFAADAAVRLRTAARDKLPTAQAARGFDFIFYPADSADELSRLAALRRHLAPTGAIWVVSLKGKAARIKDIDVMQAAKTAGLVDNKVCSFSATHTALKLVIPVSARG